MAHTDTEHAVLHRLLEAWNLFITLPEQHPDDTREFAHALHQAQHLIALRLARRVEPGTWRILGIEGPTES